MNPTVATTAINEKHLHVKVCSCFRDSLFNIRYLQLIERLFLQKLCINWWSEQFWSVNRLALCWCFYQSFTLDIAYFSVLTHFSPVSHFYTLWKRQTFSGGIEMWHWTKMGYTGKYRSENSVFCQILHSVFAEEKIKPNESFRWKLLKAV